MKEDNFIVFKQNNEIDKFNDSYKKKRNRNNKLDDKNNKEDNLSKDKNLTDCLIWHLKISFY